MKIVIENKKSEFLIALIWLLLIALIYPVAEIGLDDSWYYAFPVKTLIEQGEYIIANQISPNLYFQAAWGYLFCLPFGFSFTALRLSTLVLGLVGLLVFKRFLFELTNSNIFTLLGLLLVFFNPIYFALSYNFMTDVPFAVLSIMAISKFYSYSVNSNKKEILLAVLFSYAAFLIRQPGIVYPVLYSLLALLFSNFKVSKIKEALVIITSSIVLFFLVEYFKTQTVGYVKVNTHFFTLIIEEPLKFAEHFFRFYYVFLIYLGIFALPLFLAFSKEIVQKVKFSFKQHSLLFVINILVLVVLGILDRFFPVMGNTIHNLYLGPVLLKNISVLELSYLPNAPEWFLLFLTFAGQISGSYLISIVLKSVLKKIQLFEVFILTIMISYLGLMSITSAFDRYYLLPYLLFLITFIPKISKKRVLFSNKLLFGILIVFFAWFTVASTLDHFELTKARLKALSHLKNKGVEQAQIDAGLELNEWYYYNNKENKNKKESYSLADAQYVITIGLIEGYSVYKKIEYKRFFIPKTHFIYILENKKSNQ